MEKSGKATVHDLGFRVRGRRDLLGRLMTPIRVPQSSPALTYILSPPPDPQGCDSPGQLQEGRYHVGTCGELKIFYSSYSSSVATHNVLPVMYSTSSAQVHTSSWLQDRVGYWPRLMTVLQRIANTSLIL